ncbi:MAG: DUF47 family protein [Arenicellales bacterium]
MEMNLFRKTRSLEDKIDSFFDKFSEISVIYRLAVRVYLREGLNEEFQSRLEKVNSLESEADHLRRNIEKQLYSNMLIPDSRANVLELIERVDELMSQFEGSLWAFANESPDIPDEYRTGYKRLTNMVIRATDELALSGRAFFRNPDQVPAYNHKVMLYEKEADIITTKLKRAIFDSNLELAHKLHLREFIEQIDGIADLAEDVADRLSIYAIQRLV